MSAMLYIMPSVLLSLNNLLHSFTPSLLQIIIPTLLLLVVVLVLLSIRYHGQASLRARSRGGRSCCSRGQCRSTGEGSAVAAPVAAPVKAPTPSPHSYPFPGNFSIKLILHNEAQTNVTFKLVSPVVSKPVLVLPSTWNAIVPTVISSKRKIVKVIVTVESAKQVVVEKLLTINLLKYFKVSELKGQKFLVLTAVKSWKWKAKYLLITIDETAVLSFKL